jgi:hypothetical protein
MLRRLAVSLVALFSLLGAAQVAAAADEMRADGKLDEAVWAGARPVGEFRQVEPLTLAVPKWPVRARWLARVDGLWVGVEVDTPPDLRTRGRSARDARPLSADPVSVLVDFAGTGQSAYEFTVSLSGTLRDGQADATGQFTYDWDARWEAGTAETATGWTAELHIPWYVAAAPTSGETRTIGLWVGTFVKGAGLRFAVPEVGIDNPGWLSRMQKLEVPRYDASSLAVVPYASLTADRVRGSLRGQGGLDIAWNSGTGHQLTATLKPDFGQVESDNVVVNFSAVETFFSDKRPFFTEGGALFDVQLPGMAKLINTRRIGARADGSGAAAPVDAAVKYVGERGRWDVGAFAAMEADTGDGGQGRDFTALRLRRRWDGGALGYLGTWVDRPGLGYAARVDGLDGDVKPMSGLTLRGRAVASRRVAQGAAGRAGSGDGDAYALSAEYDDNGPITGSVQASRFSRNFELDDFGFLPRANLQRVDAEFTWHKRDYPATSRWLATEWKLGLTAQTDAGGKHLPSSIIVSRGFALHGGGFGYGWAFLQGAGADDLLTRGHGDVRLPVRPTVGYWMDTGRFGPGQAWEAELEAGTNQSGLGGSGWYVVIDPRWVVNERLTLSAQTRLDRSPDWLLWTGGATVGSYRQRQFYTGLGADAFFGARHELRMRLQWVGLGAAGRASYGVTGADPARLAGKPADFSLATLAFQLRYRYTIGPLSDIYVVYGRGGDFFEEGRDRGLGRLWRSGIAERDAEQWLVKVRYLF